MAFAEPKTRAEFKSLRQALQKASASDYPGVDSAKFEEFRRGILQLTSAASGLKWTLIGIAPTVLLTVLQYGLRAFRPGGILWLASAGWLMVFTWFGGTDRKRLLNSALALGRAIGLILPGEVPVVAPVAPVVPDAPTSHRIPFVTDAIRLARVLFSPGAVFEEQREKPTVWIPWLILSVLMVAVTLVNMPVTRQAMRLAAEARGQPMPAVAETVATVSVVVMTPVVLLVMILVSAGIMYLVLLATGGEVRFKGLMCAATFATVVGVLQLVLMAIVLKLRGPEGIRTAADMQVSFGLDLLLPADTSLPKFVEGLLRGVSPFSLWSLALMAFGVHAVERQTKGAAWSAATGSFLVLLVVGAFFAGFGGAR